MATNSWMEAAGFPQDLIDEYLRTGQLPNTQQSTTATATGSSVIGPHPDNTTGGERTETAISTAPDAWSDVDRRNEAANTRLQGLKSGPGTTTQDAARQQYRDYIESLGGRWSPETENDFNNMWRQSAEASSFGGAGLDNANLFAGNFESQKGRLQQRWLGEAGQDGPTSQYTGAGGGNYGDDTRDFGDGGKTAGGLTGGSTQGLSGDDALSALLKYLQGNRETTDKENADLRAILMKQLGELDDPVSTDDPGIREALAANRIGLQRGTEAQRREIAERRAYDESGGTGSAGYQNDVDRLLQEQGESGAMFEGQAVFQEMQQRRQQLNGLLAQAMALGDAETARLIQTELATINSQLAQSNVMDRLAFDYTNMENQNNMWLMNLLFGGNLNI